MKSSGVPLSGDKSIPVRWELALRRIRQEAQRLLYSQWRWPRRKSAHRSPSSLLRYSSPRTPAPSSVPEPETLLPSRHPASAPPSSGQGDRAMGHPARRRGAAQRLQRSGRGAHGACLAAPDDPGAGQQRQGRGAHGKSATRLRGPDTRLCRNDRSATPSASRCRWTAAPRPSCTRSGSSTRPGSCSTTAGDLSRNSDRSGRTTHEPPRLFPERAEPQPARQAPAADLRP